MRWPWAPRSARRIGDGVVAATLVVLVAAPHLLPAAAADPATDVLDQQNDVPTGLRARCDGTGRSLFQSFRPASTPLVAIALEARDVPPAGERVHVRVRAAAPDGPIVGESFAEVAAAGWVRFEFDEELLVELGGYYLIEWVEPRSWWACRDDDPYVRGEAYNCAGVVLPARDFNFRTWAPETHWEARSWGYVKLKLGS